MDIRELIKHHPFFYKKQAGNHFGHEYHDYFEFLDENDITLIIAIPFNYKGKVDWCGFLTYPHLKDTPAWFQEIVKQAEKEVNVRDKKWKKGDPTSYRSFHPTFPLAKISTGKKIKK